MELMGFWLMGICKINNNSVFLFTIQINVMIRSKFLLLMFSKLSYLSNFGLKSRRRESSMSISMSSIYSILIMVGPKT